MNGFSFFQRSERRVEISKMKKITATIFLVILFILNGNKGCAQVIIANMSFEGPRRQDIPPSGWEPCNTFSSPDTQPGFWEVTKAASHGSTYISLITRGNLGPYANNNEGIQTQLLMPFLKDSIYELSIDLSFSKEFGHAVGFGDFLRYDTPAKLRISGGLTSCSKSELLWESPVIGHEDWKNYRFQLHPKTTTINYLVFEAAYADGSTYFGNILFDNLGINLCGIAIPIETKSFDSEICEKTSIILDAFTPGGSYQWNNGSPQSFITVNNAGTYSVKVSNGCESKVFEYTITEKDCSCKITVPNIFTPNNDNVNETFEIIGTSDIAKFDLTIFNRWGKLVFETDKIYDYWKGDASPGIYYWTINMMCIDGMSIVSKSYKGSITVRR